MALTGAPQVNWSMRLRREGQVDAFTLAGGGIRRGDRFQGGPAVLTGTERLLVVADAIDEVRHFLVEAVVPGFLVDGERPALRSAGLLDRVAVAMLAVGVDGVAAEQVGVGDAVAAIDFRPVVHAA